MYVIYVNVLHKIIILFIYYLHIDKLVLVIMLQGKIIRMVYLILIVNFKHVMAYIYKNANVIKGNSRFAAYVIILLF